MSRESMASNIEIKAWADDFFGQMRLAASLADDGPRYLEQTDTFFHVPEGRLKLREFGDGTGELIQYQRANIDGPKQSYYVISETVNPRSLKDALSNALGIGPVVRKRRSVFLAGPTRLHFDEVERLGQFIELEVVLTPGQASAEGTTIAEQWMEKLGIESDHLVAGAYVDLLEESS